MRILVCTLVAFLAPFLAGAQDNYSPANKLIDAIESSDAAQIDELVGKIVVVESGRVSNSTSDEIIGLVKDCKPTSASDQMMMDDEGESVRQIYSKFTFACEPLTIENDPEQCSDRGFLFVASTSRKDGQNRLDVLSQPLRSLERCEALPPPPIRITTRKDANGRP